MVGTLIMAAGNSSRLGQNKQLLKHHGVSLLNRCVNICRKAKSKDIIVVLGSNYESLISQMNTNKVTLLFNPCWQNGLSSSIITGVLWAKAKKLSGVIVLLPDQIHFSSDLLISIHRMAHTNPQKLICSKYEKGYGAPSYFPHRFFDEILNTTKGNGAKAILDKYADERLSIDFPLGMVDIDTPDDLRLLPS